MHFGLQPAVLCNNFSNENYTLLMRDHSSGVTMEYVIFPQTEYALQIDNLAENRAYELIVIDSTGIRNVPGKVLCKLP